MKNLSDDLASFLADNRDNVHVIAKNGNVTHINPEHVDLMVAALARETMWGYVLRRLASARMVLRGYAMHPDNAVSYRARQELK